jgi:hypothetical protein
MKLRELFEQQRKVAVTAFGRMNPPTIGHEKLVDKVKSIDGDHYIFLSQTQKPKTDPLPFDVKLEFAKKFFSGVNVGHPTVRTPIQMLQMLEQLGYTDVIYVAGSDRVESFTKLFNDYNGKEYNFDSIQVVSAGERDPDADGAEGMSASKMRAAAASGDYESFATGTPDPQLAKKMYDAVRTGMGVKDTQPAEGVAEGGFFDPDQPNPGDMVKHRNGAVGKVKKIGTQGDETFVYFRDQNGEMNYGQWKKHVFPMNKVDEDTLDEKRDKDSFHTSVEKGKFMKSKYGRGEYQNAMFLHDLDSKGEPMLVTFAKQSDAENAAKKFGGKIIKSGMGTFRIVKDGDDLERIRGLAGVEETNHPTQLRDKHGNEVLAALYRIVDRKQAMPVNFMDGKGKIDLYTASAIVKVYDAVNNENKLKMRNMLSTSDGTRKLADFAFSKASQNESTEIDEAEYQGRKVQLGKPTRGDVKKFKVYVRNPKGNVVKDPDPDIEEGGFFDPDQPNPGDMVKHRNGAVGKVKKIGTQGDETFVYFRDQNGEMNYGQWKKHVFPLEEQGVAEGSEIKIPTEDGITMQDIRLMAGEGKLTKKTVLQAIAVIRKQRREKAVAEEAAGVGIVKQDYDLDQMVYVLTVDGNKVSFTYWDYEDDFQNPDIKDIYQQAKEQLEGKLSPDQIKQVARAVFKSFEQGVREASYEGNIGIMELFKFFSKAEKEDPKLVARVKEMIKQRRDKEVWRIIQDYTGTQLTGKEFEGSIKEAIFREAGHGKYWCSTDKKWKYRQGPKQSRSS